MSKEQKFFGMTIGKKKGDAVASEAPVVDKQAFTFTPHLPITNVIPDSVLQKYQVKGILNKFIFAGVGIAAVFGLVFAGATFITGNIESETNALQNQSQELNGQIQSLQPYATFSAEVDTKKQTAHERVKEDVNMGQISLHFQEAAGSSGIGLSEITVTQSASGEQTACTSPDPFTANSEIIGCITFSGVTDDQEKVSSFVDTLEALGASDENKPFYSDGFISSISSDITEGNVVSFDGTIAFTKELFSGQYNDLVPGAERPEDETATAEETGDAPINEQETEED